jgi:hypothetical protein
MNNPRLRFFLISTFILNSHLFGIANATPPPLVRAHSAGAVRPAPLARVPSAGAIRPPLVRIPSARAGQARPNVPDLEARLERERQARIKSSWAQQHAGTRNTGVRAHAAQPPGSALNPAHQAKIQNAAAAADAARAAKDQEHLKSALAEAAREKEDRMRQRLERMGGRPLFSGPR